MKKDLAREIAKLVVAAKPDTPPKVKHKPSLANINLEIVHGQLQNEIVIHLALQGKSSHVKQMIRQNLNLVKATSTFLSYGTDSAKVVVSTDYVSHFEWHSPVKRGPLTLFIAAVVINDLELTEYILKKLRRCGTSFGFQTELSIALAVSASEGFHDICLFLLKYMEECTNFSPKQKPLQYSNGITILTAASMTVGSKKNTVLIKPLLEAGADINQILHGALVEAKKELNHRNNKEKNVSYRDFIKQLFEYEGSSIAIARQQVLTNEDVMNVMQRCKFSTAQLGIMLFKIKDKRTRYFFEQLLLARKKEEKAKGKAEKREYTNNHVIRR